MNPFFLFLILFIFSDGKRMKPYIWRPPVIPKLSMPPMNPLYFDTFKMELILDRLRTITEALDKVNHLRQIDGAPGDRIATMEQIGDSLDAAKTFLADTKAEKKLDSLSGLLNGAKQFGDIESLIQNVGPLLSAFSSFQK